MSGKPRRVFVTLEIETDLTLPEARSPADWAIALGDYWNVGKQRRVIKVLQVQANVAKLEKGAKAKKKP